MVQREPPVPARLQPGFPVRTCIGCRKQALAADLFRVVAQENVVDGSSDGFILVPDSRRRLPGRGAWLHNDPKCLSEAERRRAFGRALRVSGHLDISTVVRMIDPDRVELAKPE